MKPIFTAGIFFSLFIMPWSPAKADQAFPMAQIICMPEQGYFSITTRAIWDIDPSLGYQSPRFSETIIPFPKGKVVMCSLGSNTIRVTSSPLSGLPRCAGARTDVNISINGKIGDTLAEADCPDRIYEVAVSTANFPPSTQSSNSVAKPVPHIFVDRCQADMHYGASSPHVGQVQEGNLLCETKPFD